MSYQLDLPMEEVAEKGPGLAFIAYPKAMARMPLAPLWSALFFAMILLVGLDSQFVQVESVVTAIMDLFPNILRRGKRREMLVAVVCIVDFLVGCLMVMEGGMYVFQIFDYFSASGIILLSISFCESLVIAWIYGADRFYDNIFMMMGKRVTPYLGISWKFFTPIMTFLMVVFAIAFFPKFTYNGHYVYPTWALLCGWTLTFSALIWIPVYMVYKILQYPGTFKEKWIASTRPILKAHHMRPQDWKDTPSLEYTKTVTLDPLTENPE
ncbi:UNVERIFIED_CONTAM: hypothetical protein GTU68_036164 [Idotea baltica]|nr:hypothetical protein [Idotea baltica]